MVASPPSSQTTPSADASLYISDESDYYGDDDSLAHWHALDAAASPSAYQTYRTRQPAARAYAIQQSPAPPPPKPRNPFADQRHCARQLDETPAAFVQRLRPSATDEQTAGPWLLIANPYAPQHPVQQDLSHLLSQGEALLDEFKAKQTQRNKVKARETLKKDLLAVARSTGVVSGKWLLRPHVEHVDHVWALVAEGVAGGRLGSMAKVATADRDEGGVIRVVCVYTEDFGDVEDVRRVLEGLVGLGLVKDDGVGMWYKCDAYTHLGIEAKNEWGLRASIYGSREMLKGKA